MQACDHVTVGPMIMSQGRKRTFNSLEHRKQKYSSMRAARAAAFHEHRALDRLQATHSCCQGYIPQSRAAHKQHTAARVQKVREAQPEELLAAIFMLTARSEAPATAAIDVENHRTVRASQSLVTADTYETIRRQPCTNIIVYSELLRSWHLHAPTLDTTVTNSHEYSILTPMHVCLSLCLHYYVLQTPM